MLFAVIDPINNFLSYSFYLVFICKWLKSTFVDQCIPCDRYLAVVWERPLRIKVSNLILKFIELSSIITKSECRLKVTQNSSFPFTLSGSNNSGKLPRHAIPEKGGGAWRRMRFPIFITDPLFSLNDIKTLCMVHFCCCFNTVSKNKIDYNLLSFFFFVSHHYKWWLTQKKQVYVLVCCTATDQELIFALQNNENSH